jgi:hypothetical protein
MGRKYKKIKSRARTSTDEMCKLKAFLKLLAHPIHSEGMIHVAMRKQHMEISSLCFRNMIIMDNKKYVQIDWMIGNLPWLKFSYHSGESGDLKGLHRTQLMVAMLSNKGYTFSHLHGIKNKKLKNLLLKLQEQAVELFI